MRCIVLFLAAAGLVALQVSAVRVDEDPDPSETQQQQGTDEEASASLPSQAEASDNEAQIGALQILADRKKDTFNAIEAAVSHVAGAERLANADKERAQIKSARSAIALDQKAAVQEQFAENAIRMTLHAERLAKRARDTQEYATKATIAGEEATEEHRKAKIIEGFDVQSAIHSAHAELKSKKAWNDADVAAQEALDMKRAAHEKFVMDQEVATEAADIAEVADHEAMRKSAAAKALKGVLVGKEEAYQKASQELEYATIEEKRRVAEESEAIEASRQSAAEAQQAEADKAVADQAVIESEEKHKAAKAKLAFNNIAAEEAYADAVTANEVHKDRIVKTNVAFQAVAR